MDGEKLIDAVRRRPILYECNKKSYRDADKKATAWVEVAEELGAPGLYYL